MEITVQETFQNTIQGEGYWSGLPVDFIRLYGCPVGCPWCDTGYSDGGINLPKQSRPFKALIDELESDSVVISGGEPFIHKNLSELVAALEYSGKTVHIETSGAKWQSVSDTVWVTLSPKEHISPKYPVDKRMWKRASEIKLVISSGDELEFYRSSLPKGTPIFLQPEWGDKERTIPKCLDLLHSSDLDLRLSLQTHKLIGVR
jgi:7-carboxy-7-deazaguanine synthase